MGLLNSIRALGSALATLIGGAIIVENIDGKLERFDDVGYLSIFITVLAILFGLINNSILKKKQIYEQETTN